jgi:hypothetical protein
MTVSRELSKYKFDLVGVQEFRWESGGTEPAGEYKHKPWFDEGCSILLDQRQEAKLQWLQDPSEIYVDNLNNVKM